MKLRSILIFLCGIYLSPFGALCQFKPGSYIDTLGISHVGLINHLHGASTISFKGDSTVKKTKLSSIEVTMFTIEEDTFLSKPGYGFVKCMVNGRIQFYEGESYSNVNTTSQQNLQPDNFLAQRGGLNSVPIKYHVLEKGLKRFVVTGRNFNKILSEFTVEDPEIQLLVNDKHFNYRDIKETIRLYNSRFTEEDNRIWMHEQLELGEIERRKMIPGQVVLYRRDKKQSEEQAVAIINDEIFSLNANELVKLEVDNIKTVIICDQSTDCTEIEGSPNKILYIELSLEDGGSIMTAQKVVQEVGEFNFNRITYLMNKKADN